MGSEARLGALAVLWAEASREAQILCQYLSGDCPSTENDEVLAAAHGALLAEEDPHEHLIKLFPLRPAASSA